MTALNNMVTPKVEREAEARNYGKFVISPLERGYGVTVGGTDGPMGIYFQTGSCNVACYNKVFNCCDGMRSYRGSSDNDFYGNDVISCGDDGM